MYIYIWEMVLNNLVYYISLHQRLWYYTLFYLVSTAEVKQIIIELTPSGGRLNKKDGLTRYGNSHVKDKTS